jgi:type VI secretion system protein ImpK
LKSDQIQEKRNTLTEISAECLILILQLRAVNDYGDADSLKNRISGMLDKFERESRANGIDNEKINLSKFALVAFLDETIISSSWNQKDSWLSEPLQLKLFNTFNAGEEFFDKLGSLRQRSSSNREVLEIFFLCLTLGFKGKYQLQSPENLRRVIDELNVELHPGTSGIFENLSPNGKPKDFLIQSVKGKFPVWIYPAAAIVIIIIFYIIMSASISDKASSVAEILKSMII